MFDEALNALYEAIKKSIADYSSLETTSGNYTFVFGDSTMATVLRYSGIKGMCGIEELMGICSRLAEVLNPFFVKEAYELQFVLNRDNMKKKGDAAPIAASLRHGQAHWHARISLRHPGRTSRCHG